MECNLLLQQISQRYQRILGDNLLGISVHGSLAFGCFHWQSSDVDFLVVTRQEPAQVQKEAMIQTLLDLLPFSPPKGLEMSVVLSEHCMPFHYPTPFSLHFSPIYLEACRADLAEYCRSMHGEDRDLAAHFMVARKVGFSIYGPPPVQLLRPVPRACYLDSILRDIADAEDEAPVNPVYFVLNQCRVLAYLRDALICSKEAGGLWALEHLDIHWFSLIRFCLEAYQTGVPICPEPGVLSAFCHMIQKEIQT